MSERSVRQELDELIEIVDALADALSRREWPSTVVASIAKRARSLRQRSLGDEAEEK